MRDAVFDSRRSNKACGLRKVILSEEDLLAAEQLLDRIRNASQVSNIGPPEDMWAGHEPKPADLSVSGNREALVERARVVLGNRRHRSNFFKAGMFGEPAWEMLLVLYIVDRSGRRHTIGSLADVAGARMTTALRWLDFLEGEKLIQRRNHPTDRRAVFIELTDIARHALDVYFSGTR